MDDKLCDQAFAKFFISSGIPFRVIEDVRFRNLLTLYKKTKQAYPIPNRKKLAGPLLDEAVENGRTTLSDAIKKSKNLRTGLSLCSDGMTWLKVPWLNFVIVIAVGGATLVETVDCTARMQELGGDGKDGPFIAEKAIAAIERIGAQHVVIFFTDGAGNMVAAGAIVEQKFPWIIPGKCATHAINLFFSKVNGIPQVADLISKGKAINGWVLPHHVPRSLLRSYTEKFLGKELSPVVPADTRMGLVFVMLHRHLRLKTALQAMIKCPEFITNPAAVKQAMEAGVVAIIEDDGFWDSAAMLINALWPAMYLLRLTDSDHPTSGCLLHHYRLTKQRLEHRRNKEEAEAKAEEAARERGEEVPGGGGRQRLGYLSDVVEHFRQETHGVINCLHFAGYACNPAFWDVDVVTQTDVIDGLRQFARRVFGYLETEEEINEGPTNLVTLTMKQFDQFKTEKASFPVEAQSAADSMDHNDGRAAGQWWRLYGGGLKQLQKVAIKAVSQVRHYIVVEWQDLRAGPGGVGQGKGIRASSDPSGAVCRSVWKVSGISGSERSFKMQKFMNPKARARLGRERVSKLAAAHSALKLKDRLEDDDPPMELKRWREEEETLPPLVLVESDEFEAALATLMLQVRILLVLL